MNTYVSLVEKNTVETFLIISITSLLSKIMPIFWFWYMSIQKNKTIPLNTLYYWLVVGLRLFTNQIFLKMLMLLTENELIGSPAETDL